MRASDSTHTQSKAAAATSMRAALLCVAVSAYVLPSSRISRPRGVALRVANNSSAKDTQQNHPWGVGDVSRFFSVPRADPRQPRRVTMGGRFSEQALGCAGAVSLVIFQAFHS